MPDWTAPFHRPKLTTDEYETAQKEYVAKYGYTITVPALDDIIHLKPEIRMTDDEKFLWKNKQYDAIAPGRRIDIKAMKQRRKEKYLAMLGSPSPSIVKNAGSILTSVDDAQDALTTLSVIGRLAIRYAPRLIGKAFLGPVGWIMTAADILNLVMAVGRILTMPMMGKRTKGAATADNPFSKKSKTRRARRLLKAFPTPGNIIEVLQTTDQVFGVGICLGPIVGLLQDTLIGGVRAGLGQPVKIRSELPQFPHWTQTAQRNVKSFTHFIGSGLRLSDEDEFAMLAAAFLSQQECLTAQKDYNPLDHVEDIEKTEMRAPIPTNILSLEVIEEEGIPLDEVVGWPHDGRLWTPTKEIVENYRPVGTSWLYDYMKRHEHDWYGFAGGSLASMIAEHSSASIEGEDQISYDYTPRSKWGHIMLENGIYPDPSQPEEKLRLLTSILSQYDYENWDPHYKDFLQLYEYYDIKYLTM